MSGRDSNTPAFDAWATRYSEELNSAAQEQRPDLAALAPDIRRYLTQTESFNDDVPPASSDVVETTHLVCNLRRYYIDLLKITPPSLDKSIAALTENVSAITEERGAQVKIAELRGDCIRAHVMEHYPLQEAQAQMLQMLKAEYYDMEYDETHEETPEVIPSVSHSADSQTTAGSMSPETKAAFLRIIESPEEFGRFLREAHRIDVKTLDAEDAISRSRFIRSNPDPAAFVAKVIDANTLRDIISRSVH